MRMAEKDDLDLIDADWRQASPSLTIAHVMYDPRDPKRFHVYPPAATGASLDLLTCSTPDDCATLASAIALDDVYEGPLLDFMLWRAYSKNGKNADPSKSASAFAAAIAALGVKVQADTAITATGNKP